MKKFQYFDADEFFAPFESDWSYYLVLDARENLSEIEFDLTPAVKESLDTFLNIVGREGNSLAIEYRSELLSIFRRQVASNIAEYNDAEAERVLAESEYNSLAVVNGVDPGCILMQGEKQFRPHVDAIRARRAMEKGLCFLYSFLNDRFIEGPHPERKRALIVRYLQSVRDENASVTDRLDALYKYHDLWDSLDPQSR